MQINVERHPNWYHDIPVMTTLILGSFPPHEKRRVYDFYYPNKQNRFWKILAHLSGCPLNDHPKHAIELVHERHAIMEKLHAGVENMGYEIKRKGTSALDTDIEIITFRDILSIIRAHPELQRILLPGYSAPNSTFNSFTRYLRENDITVPEIGKPRGGITSFQIVIDGRKIGCFVLNSTSTAARITFDDLLNQFRKFFPGPV